MHYVDLMGYHTVTKYKNDHSSCPSCEKTQRRTAEIVSYLWSFFWVHLLEGSSTFKINSLEICSSSKIHTDLQETIGSSMSLILFGSFAS